MPGGNIDRQISPTIVRDCLASNPSSPNNAGDACGSTAANDDRVARLWFVEARACEVHAIGSHADLRLAATLTEWRPRPKWRRGMPPPVLDLWSTCSILRSTVAI